MRDMLGMPGMANRPPRLVPVPDEHTRICSGCGYDLRGQPAGGRCPECGLPVFIPSAHDDPLSSMPLTLIRSLRLACWLGSATVIAVIALVVIAALGTVDAVRVAGSLFAVSLVWVVAAYRLTPAIDSGPAEAHGFSKTSGRRQAARRLQGAWVLAAGVHLFRVGLPAIAGTGTMETVLMGVMVVAILIGVAGVAVLALQLEQLAEWARDDDAQWAFNLAVWGVPLMTVIFIPIGTSFLWSVANPFKVAGTILAVLWVVSLATFPYALVSLAKSITWSVGHAHEHQNRLRRRYDRAEEYGAEVARTVAVIDAVGDHARDEARDDARRGDP